MLADLPVHMPREISVTHLPFAPLLSPPKVVFDKTFHLVQSWPEARVNSVVYPYLIFLFEGAANLRMGTTVEMALRQSPKSGKKGDPWIVNGCHILSAHAPAVLLFPPGVPYSDGSDSHWIQNDSQHSCSQIMWLHVLSAGVLCHLSSSTMKPDGSQHPLLVKDAALPQLIELLNEELRQREGEYEKVAQSLLHTIFLRVQRRLQLDKPAIGNSAWRRSTASASLSSQAAQAQAARCIAAVDEYVQTYLTQSITVPDLAHHCQLSPTHLNRLFHTMLGMSVKRYVNQQRILAAQGMLVETNLNIKEISYLVGFKQTTHFCQVFRCLTNVSPRRYREQNRHNENQKRLYVRNPS